MPNADDFLFALLKACESQAPSPLFPKIFAAEMKLDRHQVDVGLDELRRRGLVSLTEWGREFGQGVVLTTAGFTALQTGRLPTGTTPTASPPGDTTRDDEGRVESVREAMLAPRRAPVMRVLFALILFYFLFGACYAMYFDLSVEDYLLGRGRDCTHVLIDLGAVHPIFFVRDHGPSRPQFERIALFSFLHVGILHLGMNLYFLVTLGRIIETIWGSWRFLLIYVISGLVSGCTILLISLAQTTDLLQIPPTAGASGCLYGIFVSMIVWFSMNYAYLPDKVIEAWSHSLRVNVILLIVINFLPGISWQGHFGGAVGGLIAGVLLHVQRFHESRLIRLLALVALPIVPIIFFVAVLRVTGWL